MAMTVMWGLGCEPGEASGNWGRLPCDLMRALDNRQFLIGSGTVMVNERPGPRLESAAQLMQWCADWRDGVYRIAPKQDSQDYQLSVGVWTRTMRMDLLLAGEQLKRRQRTLVGDSVAVMRQMVDTHAGAVRFGPNCSISVRNLSFPRVRPPRAWPVVGTSSIVDLVDPRFEEGHGRGAAAGVLASRELPEGVSRDLFGEVIVIRWISDEEMPDERALRGALSARDEWLARNLEGTIAEGWSAAGETDSTPVAAAPHPTLTLFSAPLGVGYKAIHTAEGEAAVRAELKRVGQWIKAGRLDDGTELADVIVIAENRESALALRPLAASEGIPHLVYVGEDGRMWNPFPEGEWTN